MAALKPAYFFFGNDDVKIAAARKRLAERAQQDGALLEQFKGDSCTPDAFAAAIMSPSLLGGGRILLADGVSRWKAADVGPVADALKSIASAEGTEDTLVVMLGEKKPVAAIESAIVALGGEVKEFKAPSAKKMPDWLRAQATARGVELEPQAAQLMVDLAGADRPRYLLSELEKLAVYCQQSGTITRDDVAELGTGDAVPKAFALTDAVMQSDARRAVELARELLDAGERPQSIQFALVRSFTQAQRAAAVMDDGGDVASELGIAPWLAGKVSGAARARGQESLQYALQRLAQLDFDTKGGNQLDDETNLFVTLEAIA